MYNNTITKYIYMKVLPSNILKVLLKTDEELGIKRLSLIMECNESTVRRIIDNKLPVPNKSIKKLASFFKTDEAFWNNLNNNYKISKSKEVEKVMKFTGDVKDKFEIIKKLTNKNITVSDLLKKTLSNTTIEESSLFIGVPRKTLSDLINNKTNLSIQMAFKLSYAFNTDINYWLSLKKEPKNKLTKMEIK